VLKPIQNISLAMIGLLLPVSFLFAGCVGDKNAAEKDSGLSDGDGMLDDSITSADSQPADENSGSDSSHYEDEDSAPPANPSAGCGSAGGVYGPGTTEGALFHGGRRRTFLVHVPPQYQQTRPAPLVILLHGGNGSGAKMEQMTGFDTVADREGLVAVYPDGTGPLKTWNGGICCGYAVENNVDDVGFIMALLDHLENTLCLDCRRVFVTGASNGAFMAHRLGCEAPNRIAAIAPVAGQEGSPTCSPVRPVAVMQIHGTLDAHAPWNGGEGCGFAGIVFPSVPDTMEGWRMRNSCQATVHRLLEEGDGECDSYDDCAPGGETVLCAIVGGGHSWPGGEAPPADQTERCPEDGPHCTNFHASEQIWKFFSRQALP